MKRDLFGWFVAGCVICYFAAAAIAIAYHIEPLLILALIVEWIAWQFVTAALGGWTRLAKLYRAQVVFTGDRMRVLSARMAETPYGFLRIGCDAHGIHLSMAPLVSMRHPPLFVPWTHVKLREQSGQLDIEFLRAPEVTLKIRGQRAAGALLAQAAASHPGSLSVDSETQRAAAALAASPPRPIGRYAWIPVAMIVAAYAVTLWINNPDRKLHRIYDEREAEASRIVAQTQPPSDAVRISGPAVTRNELHDSLASLGHIFVREDYSRHGSFEDTAAWYSDELSRQGWIVKEKSDRAASFCRGAWSVDVEQTGSDTYRLDVSWWAGGVRCAR